MRIGGITADTVLEEREPDGNGDVKSVKSTKNIQEQWVSEHAKELPS